MALKDLFKKVAKRVGKGIATVIKNKTGVDLTGLLAVPEGMTKAEWKTNKVFRKRLKELISTGKITQANAQEVINDDSNPVDADIMEQTFAEVENETKGLFKSRDERKEEKSLWGKLFPKDVKWYKRVGVWIAIIIGGVIVWVFMKRKKKARKW